MLTMTTLEMQTNLFPRMSVCDFNLHSVIFYVSNFFIILCTAPQNNAALPIRRRMREQHESDSEDVEENVMEDVARQYFIYSILVHVAPRL